MNMDWDEAKGYAPLVLRLFLGVAFVIAGLDKIFTFSAKAGMFGNMFGGVGSAVLILAIVIELVCGLALVLGVYTRWAAVPLMAMMVVAFVVTFGVGESPNVIATLREIMVLNTGGSNIPVNWAFFAGLLSLFLSGSEKAALKPEE